MKISVPKIDGRNTVGDETHPVFDAETGRALGYISSRRGSRFSVTPSWSISLFDDKYKGEFDRWDECRAFAEGVESVIRNLTSKTPARAVDAA